MKTEHDDELLAMTDVPSHIWDKTYRKWSKALIAGWDEEVLWVGCDLCVWCNNHGDGICRRCPLRSGIWCVNFADRSRLHIDYYKCMDTTWEEAIKEFLVYLKPYCTDETD